jgi:hypothetical protein
MSNAQSDIALGPAYSECKANPLTGLSVEFRYFFKISIERSGEIAGF